MTGYSQSLGKVYSKVINIFMTLAAVQKDVVMEEFKVCGVDVKFNEEDIQSRMIRLMQLEAGLAYANYYYGVNQQVITKFYIDNGMKFNSYFYNQVNYRLLFSESEFKVKVDDYKYEMIKQ